MVLGLEARHQDEVSVGGIEELAQVRRGFARKLAHRLVSKGWFVRVGRGRYLLTPSHYGPDAGPEADPLRVGSHLVRPYYFGYGSAAELWGLLLSAGRTYYLASPARAATKIPGPARFRLVHVSPARFFGTTELRRRGTTLVVSDRERTVLDCLQRPELSGGMAGATQVLARAKPTLRWARLARYLRRSGSRSLARRLGYLADHIRPSVRPPQAFLRRLQPGARAPWVPLGSPRSYGRAGRRDPRWRVVLNVPERELFAEADTR